eukprot:g22820.t1
MSSSSMALQDSIFCNGPAFPCGSLGTNNIIRDDHFFLQRSRRLSESTFLAQRDLKINEGLRNGEANLARTEPGGGFAGFISLAFLGRPLLQRT